MLSFFLSLSLSLFLSLLPPCSLLPPSLSPSFPYSPVVVTLYKYDTLGDDNNLAFNEGDVIEVSNCVSLVIENICFVEYMHAATEIIHVAHMLYLCQWDCLHNIVMVHVCYLNVVDLDA